MHVSYTLTNALHCRNVLFKIIHPRQTIPASKHLAFIFYLIPHCPNYSSNLNLPKNLVKLCTEIKCNTELYIIKIAEDNLTKQNPNKNKKGLNAKHRFTPRENPSTLPIHKMSPPNNTTDTQDTQPIYEVHSFNCNKPQKYSQNDTAIPKQPKIIHTLERTYTHSPSSNHPSCK